jgi:hypothetical protein
MSQLTQALTNAATRNRELLSVLTQTDYADKTLQQNAAYISDLDTQIKATDKELKKLHALTEDERKDHVKYRDSTFRRYAHKLGGRKGEAKFASKSEKEEREFLQAWQSEREAEERRAELQRALDSATQDRQRLENDKARHASAQHDLDDLYTSIFSGPTPELPGEDQLESAVQNAKQHLEQTQTQYNAENAALEALRRVENRMQAAARAVEEALDNSRLDMMGFGFADMMERDALSQAAVALSEALRHMDEARRQQPAIVHLRTVHIDMGHLVSDVMFDNIFSDYSQHERIHESNNQLGEAMVQLKGQIELQMQRARGAVEALKGARAGMEEARAELQSIRAEAFERLAGGGSNVSAAAPPPSYAVAEGGFGGYEAQPGYSVV